MGVQGVAEIISQVGFPIFVAAYLLIHLKNETRQTRDVLLKLESTIAKLCFLVNGGKKEE